MNTVSAVDGLAPEPISADLLRGNPGQELADAIVKRVRSAGYFLDDMTRKCLKRCTISGKYAKTGEHAQSDPTFHAVYRQLTKANREIAGTPREIRSDVSLIILLDMAYPNHQGLGHLFANLKDKGNLVDYFIRAHEKGPQFCDILDFVKKAVDGRKGPKYDKRSAALLKVCAQWFQVHNGAKPMALHATIMPIVEEWSFRASDTRNLARALLSLQRDPEQGSSGRNKESASAGAKSKTEGESDAGKGRRSGVHQQALPESELMQSIEVTSLNRLRSSSAESDKEEQLVPKQKLKTESKGTSLKRERSSSAESDEEQLTPEKKLKTESKRTFLKREKSPSAEADKEEKLVPETKLEMATEGKVFRGDAASRQPKTEISAESPNLTVQGQAARIKSECSGEAAHITGTGGFERPESRHAQTEPARNELTELREQVQHLVDGDRREMLYRLNQLAHHLRLHDDEIAELRMENQQLRVMLSHRGGGPSAIHSTGYIRRP